ncbi:MAG: hypothetical protein PXZ07_10475 [Candidatus Eremiobacteraeota bacterium]|nr:hypothetical protein [Candidatus Eremiobacteraeota bacterium]
MKRNDLIRSAVFFVLALAMVGALCAPALAVQYTLTVQNDTPHPFSMTTVREFCMRSPLPEGAIQPHSRRDFTIDTEVNGGCINPRLASKLILGFHGGKYGFSVPLEKFALRPWGPNYSTSFVHTDGSLTGVVIRLGK